MFDSTRRPTTPDTLLRSVRTPRLKLLARVRRDYKAYQALAVRAEKADRAARIRELKKELRELEAGRGRIYYSQGAEKDFQRMIDLLTASTAVEVILAADQAVIWAGEENRHVRRAREAQKSRAAPKRAKPQPAPKRAKRTKR